MFYRQLHGLRGLASLMVFWAHISAGYSLHVHNVTGNHDNPEDLQFMLSHIGTFGVEIFFFLSGFVIFKSALKEQSKVFFTRRVFRVYPIFLLFSLVFIASNLVTNSAPDVNNIQSILLALTFTNEFFGSNQLTPNAWSVVYEVWYYFGLYYVVSFFIKKERFSLLHLAAFVVLAWFIIEKPVTIYFLLGALLCVYIDKVEAILAKINLTLVNVGATGLLIYLLYLVGQGTEFGSSGWLNAILSIEVLLPVLLLAVMALLFKQGNMMNRCVDNKFFLFLGNISYTLYLLHPYTYLVCRIIIKKLNISHEWISFSLFFIVTTIVTILASHIISKFYEMPVYSYFSKKEIYT